MVALSQGREQERLEETRELLDRAIVETRTLSHLLHPPSLDIAGFASAATWYVDGFGKRSGIKTSLELPVDLDRLPPSVETALFRIMQEALTNVHRHSESRAVDIALVADPATVTLLIRDFGRGIPQDILEGVNQSGANTGVGLSGIRERVKELGGSFSIRCGPVGTTLEASVPVGAHIQDALDDLPTSQMFSSFVS